jgi:Ca2+:H+ antiporter
LGRNPDPVVVGLVVVGLVGAVLSAAHHAEMVAHRVGEPFGSLIVTVAVTVIEVDLIVPRWSPTAATLGPGATPSSRQ